MTGMEYVIDGKIDRDMVRSLLPERKEDAHKGDMGRVLVVCGMAGMPGAAYLAGAAALRSGSGLVYCATAKPNFTVIQTLMPEMICREWNDVFEQISSEISFGSGMPYEKGYDAICFGPGMGTGFAAKRMLKSLLLAAGAPLIIDADGLNLIADDEELSEIVRNYAGTVIMTPHMGEAARLIDIKTGSERMPREEMAISIVTRYDVICVLKGSGTLVAQRAEKDTCLWQNITGNPGMATAGSGDVLAGVITSLCGRGMDPVDAAKAGVYLHGRAGDMAAIEKGEDGMVAGDILERLPGAFCEMRDMRG